MTSSAYLELISWTVAFVLVALPLGAWAVGLAEGIVSRAVGEAHDRGEPSLLRLSLALLVGFGIEGYVGVVLGLAHAFYAWVIALAGALVLLAGHRVLRAYWLWAYGRRGRLRRLLASPWRIAGVGIATALFVSNLAAAVAPPTLPDELSYHIPEAELVVATHHLPLNLGGHYFYGNIPKLGEVLYAEAISVSGNLSLPRVLQMMILLAFLIYVAAALRELVSSGAALLAVCFLLYLDDLTQYGPSAYVDTAAACYEVAALVSAAIWVQSRRNEFAAIAALLLGLGLSVKYSPLPATLYLSVVLVAGLLKVVPSSSTRVRLGVSLGFITLATCGFWYAKNAVRFENPFYPLYLGHAGVTNAEYRSLVDAIQQFGPRTLHAFLRIPMRFNGISALPLFLGSFLFPLAVLVRRAAKAMAVLVGFVPLYTAYWFFLGTHQTRFLASAESVVVILLAVVIVALEPLRMRALASGIAFAALLFGAPHMLQGVAGFRSVAANKLASPYWSYAVGEESRKHYLESAFGCEYGALEYAQQRLQGTVIDNWTQWHDNVLNIFITRTPFQNFAPVPGSSLREQLHRGALRYVYVRASLKKKFGQETRSAPDTLEAAYFKPRYAAEQKILRFSKLIWREGECRIYRIEGV